MFITKKKAIVEKISTHDDDDDSKLLGQSKGLNSFLFACKRVYIVCFDRFVEYPKKICSIAEVKTDFPTMFMHAMNEMENQRIETLRQSK